ncbi:hypothetical protein [Curtobacterium oceanosedimentum]
MSYAKPWLSIDEQIALLRERGLSIEDHDRAAAALQESGYYRLSGYLYPFRVSGTETDESGRQTTVVLEQ